MVRLLRTAQEVQLSFDVYASHRPSLCKASTKSSSSSPAIFAEHAQPGSVNRVQRKSREGGILNHHHRARLRHPSSIDSHAHATTRPNRIFPSRSPRSLEKTQVELAPQNVVSRRALAFAIVSDHRRRRRRAVPNTDGSACSLSSSGPASRTNLHGSTVTDFPIPFPGSGWPGEAVILTLARPEGWAFRHP